MLNLNVVDIHCLNFPIKKTNVFLVNKAVKLLGENFFALLSSLLSNLEVLSFQFLTNFKAWLPSSPTHALHFVYWVVFKESWASLGFCLSYKATFYLFKLKIGSFEIMFDFVSILQKLSLKSPMHKCCLTG